MHDGAAVPVCPMGVAGFLLMNKWVGDDVVLDKVVDWLSVNGIDDVVEFNGAVESDFVDFSMWNSDVQDCLRRCFASATLASASAVPMAGARVKRQRTMVAPHAVGDASVHALSLFEKPTDILDVRGCGPGAALRKLASVVPKDSIERREWLSRARAAAIIGSCPKSHNSLKSGVRNWIEFVRITTGNTDNPFPPDFELVIAWSHTFRCLGTFCNYLGYLRSACQAMGFCGPPVIHPALSRAKNAIVKRMVFTPRCGYYCLTYTVYCSWAVLLVLGRRCSYKETWY